MSKYKVTLLYTATKQVEVEADSKEEANNKAMDEGYVCLCHQCADEIEIDDDWNIADIQELKDE